VLALLLETVRDPEAFRAQLARAAELEIPVLAMKVGRTEASQAMVTAHSGALAGEHGAYEALFEAYGVHEIRTLDEMADTMELFSCPPGARWQWDRERARQRRRAGDVRRPGRRPRRALRPIGSQTVARIADCSIPAWRREPPGRLGTGIDGDAIFPVRSRRSPTIPRSVSVFCVDMTHQGEPWNEGYLQISIDRFEATDKPFCGCSNLRARCRDEAKCFGTAASRCSRARERVRALRHRCATRPGAPVRPRAAGPVDDAVRERGGRGSPKHADVRAGRRRCSPTTAAGGGRRPVATAADDRRRWTRRYPVVVKTAASGITHKSDVVASASAAQPTRSATRTRTSPDASVLRPSSPHGARGRGRARWS
jgi:hypothetical protein